ncbi:MAG: NAD(P)H-binding protein [Anaerolineales bacterium]|nr:MAG: NAD(P)H-binding protein [Anaerolineales bacterium]
MPDRQVHAVTGAYGYSGKYIARRLLDEGHQVITLTNSIHRANPFGDKVRAYPFNFDDPERLTESLKGVSVLYNTYWVRFNHQLFRHADAVSNTKLLFSAAREAGVKRIVHVSITNPSPESHLEYFSGKGKLEETLRGSGLSYAILRPTVLFGKEDILINNIAWVLRRLPLFGVFGHGEYRLQPIYVDDLAEIAVLQGAERENTIINAIGPETFSYRGLVEAIGDIIGKRRPIISVSPEVGYLAGAIIGKVVGDVFITREEIQGLMAGLLYVDTPPTGKTRLTDWAKEHAHLLGRNYASELARREDRRLEYERS